MDPYYHCIKYRNPADKNIHGTDSFMIAESMRLFQPIFVMLRDFKTEILDHIAVARNNFNVTCDSKLLF